MPNHVTHKIIFDAAELPAVLKRCCTDGQFDFAKLIPPPPHMYQGSLGAEDEEDFTCNWLSWSRENWGTKWNAYDGTSGVDGDRAFIQFDTAWSVPYPAIVAFSNAFPDLAFEHRYFDEGHNFWGIETWKKTAFDQRAYRVEKRFKKPEDESPLCVELKGYDPAKEFEVKNADDEVTNG